ncbi:hypothetical protein [Lacibacter sp. H407]|uniref:hypothetical protein n=1 Tax=Lacibacter sp. H407 TaxID=3133423 RepID=UPI0030C4606B
MKRFFLLLLVILLSDCSLLSAQDVGFKKAIDSINVKLEQWAEPGNVVYIKATVNGNISIINKREQYQRFNLFELANEPNDRSTKKNGIELLACEERAHAPLTWMNFYTANGQVAFIRLTCKIPAAELEHLYNAFMHLRSLCKKS